MIIGRARKIFVDKMRSLSVEHPPVNAIAPFCLRRKAKERLALTIDFKMR